MVVRGFGDEERQGGCREGLGSTASVEESVGLYRSSRFEVGIPIALVQVSEPLIWNALER